MIADTKKCQTLINVAAQQIAIVRAAIETIKTVRTTFQTVDPDTTGTALEGNLAAINTAISQLDDVANAGANGAVWDGMIAAAVPSHRSAALE